ncbi:PREDICTED: uncharacterized protein LOC108558102 [Nicrophorus vespilloides]|uniref:Uncharacterized protein LOC108558102 n=1 Tax=Nicrophorus vespilloides TaxID=110193 RepID=A0ABM1M749_NICVS|nr:PREDICTED: uncharacterized protein LOC108558102 [Nicrophorus vespilloides]
MVKCKKYVKNAVAGTVGVHVSEHRGEPARCAPPPLFQDYGETGYITVGTASRRFVSVACTRAACYTTTTTQPPLEANSTVAKPGIPALVHTWCISSFLPLVFHRETILSKKMAKVPIVLLLAVFIIRAHCQEYMDLDEIFARIFCPEKATTMQAQALRHDIIGKIASKLAREGINEDEDLVRKVDEMNKKKESYDDDYYRMAAFGKRNLAALARAGYIRTLPDEDNGKRSIANLAKNGQLPNYQNDAEKRGIESLARNGELHNKREIEDLIDELYEKRNIANLARSYSFPYGKRYIGSLARSGELNRFHNDKRNVASLARGGNLLYGKRNVAALLRQDKIHGPNDRSYDDMMKSDAERDSGNGDKRNLASIKAGYKQPFKRSVETRKKRQADYYEINDEYASPVLQNQNVFEYEELIKALTGEYPNTDKRFLGSVAKSGWFRPSASSRFTSRIDKRHIGSLARLGWLPSFRSVRRFNRSGRSSNECYREASADGQTKEYAFPEDKLPVDDKRFLLQPAVDRILLQRVLMQPRNH